MAASSRASFAMRMVLALLLTAVLGFVLYWGFLRPADTPASGGMRVSADFAASPDGPVAPRFDTGQPTFVSDTADDPGARFRVENGCITFAPNSTERAAAYLSTPDMERPVHTIGADIVFRRPGATQGAAALVVSDGFDASQVPPMKTPFPIHFVITPINWNLSVQKSTSEGLDVVAAGSIDPPLSEAGDQPFRVQLSISGGQVTLDISTGIHEIIKDPRIAEWAGNFATFESFANFGQTDSTACFQDVWADSRGQN